MRVLIVDDHKLFASGLELLLGGLALAEDVSLDVSIKSSLDELISPEASDFGLVLLDYHLPTISGEQLLKRAKKQFTKADIIIISSDDSREVIYNAMSFGAVGFIPKSSSKEILVSALKLVIAGGSYFPPIAFDDVNTKPTDKKLDLTDRQKAVLSLAAKGLQNKQIGDELNISEGTVKAHLHTAFKELGVRNRTEAALVLND